MTMRRSLSNDEYMDSPEFFSTLFGYTEGLLEFRSLPGVDRIFIPPFNDSTRVSFCRQNLSKNLYFGVATKDGDGGKKQNIVSIPCLHCDLDFKLTPLESFRKNFANFNLPETARVESGNGLHLYWKLKEPLTRADIPALENVNKRIAACLGGDPGSCDSARILRVPGSLNHKYSPPRPVKLVVLNKNEYELSDFDFLADLPKETRHIRGGNSDKWISKDLRGVPEGTRHPTGIRLAGYFLSLRMPPDVIEEILRLWNEKNIPPLSETRLKEITNNIRRYEQPKGDRNEKHKIRIILGDS